MSISCIECSFHKIIIVIMKETGENFTLGGHRCAYSFDGGDGFTCVYFSPNSSPWLNHIENNFWFLNWMECTENRKCKKFTFSLWKLWNLNQGSVFLYWIKFAIKIEYGNKEKL